MKASEETEENIQLTSNAPNKKDDPSDPWDVFGEEDSSNDGNHDDDPSSQEPRHPPNTLHDDLAQAVTRVLSAQPFNTPLALRKVGILVNSTETVGGGAGNGAGEQLLPALCNRGLVAHLLLLDDDAEALDGGKPWDALILDVQYMDDLKRNEVGIFRSLVARGVLMVAALAHDQCGTNRVKTVCDPSCWDSGRWMRDTFDHGSVSIVTMTRKFPRVQSETCPWLNRLSTRSIDDETRRIESATVHLCAEEVWQTRALSERSIQKAVYALLHYGYCILPRLLPASACLEMGSAVLQDVKEAAQVLLQTHGVDLFHPLDSKQEPAVYRELSLREDFRLDLRNGPCLDRLRMAADNCFRDASTGSINVDGNTAWTVRDDTRLTEFSAPFFRGQADLLEIVRRCMNPTCDRVAKGNLGRFNFDASSIPGTLQDLRVGRLGAVVSFPGAAEQALHADTPHLFETDVHLPPHYINAFTPARNSVDGVGQTALVHGSHRLEVASRLLVGDAWHGSVVRPRLDPGDVLLFDCRILHFGLANPSDSGVERAILYTNMTMSWFHDPKNWDEHQRIFTETIDM